MATEASKQAHEEAKKHAPSNETRILNLIQGLKHHGATKKEIELSLGMKHQTVTSRMSSLRDQGKIYLLVTDKPKDGCTIWYATPERFIEQRAKERRHAKYVKWLKTGADKYGITSNTINKINLDYNQQNFH